MNNPQYIDLGIRYSSVNQPFHLYSSMSDCRSVQVGRPRFSQRRHLIVDLSFHSSQNVVRSLRQHCSQIRIASLTNVHLLFTPKFCCAGCSPTSRRRCSCESHADLPASAGTSARSASARFHLFQSSHLRITFLGDLRDLPVVFINLSRAVRKATQLKKNTSRFRWPDSKGLRFLPRAIGTGRRFRSGC